MIESLPLHTRDRFVIDDKGALVCEAKDPRTATAIADAVNERATTPAPQPKTPGRRKVFP